MPVRCRSCHQPLRPISCSLLHPAASAGSTRARFTTRYRIPASSGEITPTSMEPQDASRRNRKNHQNSLLDARPENVAYFLKQTEIAWPKFIESISLRLPDSMVVHMRPGVHESACGAVSPLRSSIAAPAWSCIRHGIPATELASSCGGGWDATACDVGFPASAAVNRKCLPRRSTTAATPPRRGGDASHPRCSAGARDGYSPRVRGFALPPRFVTSSMKLRS